jgi:anti-anti-sigma factor
MQVSPIREHLVRVTLSGRLDTAGVDRIETRFIASLVPAGNSAIIDLSRVDFVASMGIRMLVSAARSLRTRKAALAVYSPQEQVRQVFELVALQQLLAVCGSEADALAAVAAPPV